MKQTHRPPAKSKRPLTTSVRTLLLIVSALAINFGAVIVHAEDGADRRTEAHTQFARAEALRMTLEAKPEHDRTVKEYKEVVTAYRRVYLITPHAAEVPDALNEVGELYRTMGEQFDHAYFNSAIDAYQFLLREYPISRYREHALLSIADAQRNGLGAAATAEKTYQDFLKQYPKSSNAILARKALADIRAADTAPKDGGSVATAKYGSPDAASSQDPQASRGNKPGRLSEVSHIRAWNADTYTRVIIQMGDGAHYQTARISNPDRIYFDIENSALSPELIRQSINVPPDGYLKSVRVAQNRANVVRVVMEVAQVKDYSVFQLPNPTRLVVDVYGPNAATTTAELRPPSAPPAGKPVIPGTPNGPAAAPRAPVAGPPALSKADAPSAASARKAPVDVSMAKPLEPAKKLAKEPVPPTIPEPMHNGEQSLTRALGLKIGRIVIDAGHGGHDTGTIGPTGLMEKDLCLDVALRVGTLVQKRLPGTEIVFTREDDTFVSLEKRTSIANAAKADLFVSIHANSSDDDGAAGIETYYLNFNASPEAMEVAARENALSQTSVHDLQDLVNKIATNAKIEESRDLATDIQASLTKRMQGVRRSGRNRGVRKAPFLVLIGANMPSVLSEVSFLSNPTDEQWLKKPENRDRLAEGLYQGIESYLQSTNSFTSNLTPSGRAAAAASPAAASTAKPTGGAAGSPTATAPPSAPLSSVGTSAPRNSAGNRSPAATDSPAANSAALAHSGEAQ
jgi:N-acetylmuramoyl-L-alanine amidase